jgi:hypothetical protein
MLNLPLSWWIITFFSLLLAYIFVLSDDQKTSYIREISLFSFPYLTNKITKTFVKPFLSQSFLFIFRLNKYSIACKLKTDIMQQTRQSKTNEERKTEVTSIYSFITMHVIHIRVEHNLYTCILVQVGPIDKTLKRLSNNISKSN